MESHKLSVSFIIHVLNFPGMPVFANFTIEVIRKETGLMLKFVDLSRK